LEIAPGFGRWTQFLIQQCDHYVGVDIAERCVRACRERFADSGHAEFATNDGSSLPMVTSGSIDFAFSFDSLVHVERDVIGAYLLELKEKLSPTGVAFIHHSNLGSLQRDLWLTRRSAALTRLVPRSEAVLRRMQMIDWTHSRAPTLSAAAFADLCAEAGLRCIGQEIVNWGGRRLLDCFSLATRPGSPFERANVRVHNAHFMDEARSAEAAERAFGSIRHSDPAGEPVFRHPAPGR
jgi:SAM-dependent methyltransferase